MNKIKLISLLAAAAVMTGSVAMAETYSATGNGYHGEMTVNVTIEDGKITDVELGDNRNLFVVSVILIAGVGGLTLNFGKVTLTQVACALILGILTNLILKKRDGKKSSDK